jgi:large subunit ribosomal protein L10
MARSDRAAAVKEIAALFNGSSAAVLTEYRGLTVAQLTELRRSLGRDTTYAVVKNTLASIAATEAGVSAFEGQLAGPTAIAFVAGDPVEAAKGLRDFAKANPQLIVKSGYLEGRAISAADVAALADLESREVLLSKVAGVLKATQSKAASLFQAPLSKTVRTVDALREKVSEGAPAAAEEPAAASEPAAEETVDA